MGLLLFKAQLEFLLEFSPLLVNLVTRNKVLFESGHGLFAGSFEALAELVGRARQLNLVELGMKDVKSLGKRFLVLGLPDLQPNCVHTERLRLVHCLEVLFEQSDVKMAGKHLSVYLLWPDFGQNFPAKRVKLIAELGLLCEHWLTKVFFVVRRPNKNLAVTFWEQRLQKSAGPVLVFCLL